jgi:hypothetical protein
MRKTILFFAVIISLVFCSTPLFSQEPYAVLEYFGNEQEISIFDSEGFEYEFLNYGMDLLPGDRIVTKKTTAELRLDPNGSIVKIAADTTFQIDSIQGRENAESNNFSLFNGKIRSIAANISGAQYQVRTPSAVCGIRGTDFGIEVVQGLREAVAVLEGQVEYTLPDIGRSINVGAGQFADALSSNFQPQVVPAAQLRQLFDEMDFEQLDKNAVPSEQLAAAEEESGEEEAQAEEDGGTEEEQADGESGSDEAAADEEDTGGDDPAADDGDQSKVEPVAVDEESGKTPDQAPDDETDEAAAEGGFLDSILKALRLEAGAVSIDGKTYSKATIQPVITLGSFRLGLYLPVIYSGNLFDPADWHHPKGNNEWSFGTDKDWTADPLAGISDLLTDIALKIKFLEIGEQRDPFFLKIGNIESMSVGHGILMSGYANDADFPSVRRIGINLGLDFDVVGIEAVVNDLAEPEIFGGRFFIRPIPDFNAAIGLSAISDIDPAGDLPSTIDSKYLSADPIFLNMALDLDIPVIETDPASLIIFGDIGGMIPKIADTAATVTPGFRTEVLLGSGSEGLDNYGWMTGIFGNVAIMDYQVDFRYAKGIFRHGFYNAPYDRLRGEYAIELVDYLENPAAAAYNKQTLGIHGEAGFTFGDFVRFEAGYFWPWSIETSGAWVGSDDDLFRVGLSFAEGLLPLGISASVYYTRTKFLPALLYGQDSSGATLTLFDENTVLEAEVAYPVAPTFKIVGSLTTHALRNPDGSYQYEDGAPKIGTSFAIETRLGF